MGIKSRRASDDELSEVVRHRLQNLLADIPPRRALPHESTSRSPDLPGSVAASNAAGSAASDPASSGASDDGADPDPAAHEPDPAESITPSATGPRHALVPPGLAMRARAFVMEHVVVIGIVVLTGCLWAGYSMFQARTGSVAVAASDPSVQVSVAATSTPSPRPSLLVHVLGEVRRPGVVSLADGARVQDAIKAAGGMTRRAKPGGLNLAAKVTDGAQLVIGRTGSSVSDSAATGTPDTPAPIDLNTATAEQLDTLPGVGPVTAAKILAWREQHGRFRAVAELQEVDGIGPKSYAEIAPHVRV